MSTSADRRDRPITRADLEAKLGQIRDATESGSEGARGVGIVVGVVAVTAVVVVAFWLGNRRGRKRRTIVEVRRV
ncbi:MAG TPA: hypothetical protein VF152_00645 [Acidimicrobiia bacterium]